MKTCLSVDQILLTDGIEHAATVNHDLLRGHILLRAIAAVAGRDAHVLRDRSRGLQSPESLLINSFILFTLIIGYLLGLLILNATF